MHLLKKFLFKPAAAVFALIQIVSANAFAYSDIISKPDMAEKKERSSAFEDVLDYKFAVDKTEQYVELLKASAALPSVYDPREADKNISGWQIRNQGTEGNCWAFSAVAAREAWKNKQNGIYPKYSEYHMAASLYRNTSDNTWTFSNRKGSGGNREMAAAYYSRGSGPVLINKFDEEAYDDYYKKTTSLEAYNNDIRSVSADEQVADAVFLTEDGSYLIKKYNIGGVESNYPAEFNGNNISVIKQAVLDYGAVMTGYYSSEGNSIKSDKYFNRGKSAYCYCPEMGEIKNSGDMTSNHAVTIIGWDDDYSYENFKRLPSGITGLPKDKTEMNGAWIVRNSWGGSGYFKEENGYEYISYYDFLIGSSSAAFPGEIKMTSYINQYDGLCPNSRYVWKTNEINVKNSFETKTDNIELIRGIGVMITEADMTVGVRIDSEITEDDDNSDAQSIRLKAKSDTKCVDIEDNTAHFNFPGFYILEPEEDIAVSGEYEVILDCSVPEHEGENTISFPILADSKAWFSSANVVVPGKSSWFSGKAWMKESETDFPIKTYNDIAGDTFALADKPVSSGENKTMRLEVFYSHADKEKCDGKTAILAVYNKSGRLCGIVSKEIDLNGSLKQDITIEYKDADKYKVMVWDDINSPVPVWRSMMQDIPQ